MGRVDVRLSTHSHRMRRDHLPEVGGTGAITLALPHSPPTHPPPLGSAAAVLTSVLLAVTPAVSPPSLGPGWFCLISTSQEEEGEAGCGRDGAVYEGHKNILREPSRGGGMVSSQPSQPRPLSLRLGLPTSVPPHPGSSSPPTSVPFPMDLCLISF